MPTSISCIIPVFNGEAFVGEALDSIFAQTLLPAEVIVVDDGSGDGTADVVRRFGGRVRYLRQENAGPAAARNRGVEAASGGLITFLDADDVWLEEKLARQAQIFAKRPELEILLTHVRNFWVEELRAEEESMQDHPLTAPALPGYVTQAMMARRHVFDTIGPFNEDLRVGEDTDWFLRAFDRGAFLDVLPDVLVLRRFHEGNLSRQRAAIRDQLVDAVARSLRRRRSQPPKAQS